MALPIEIQNATAIPERKCEPSNVTIAAFPERSYVMEEQLPPAYAAIVNKLDEILVELKSQKTQREQNPVQKTAARREQKPTG